MSDITEPNLAGLNVAFIEDLYESYLRDPLSVTEDWIEYFNG